METRHSRTLSFPSSIGDDYEQSRHLFTLTCLLPTAALSTLMSHCHWPDPDPNEASELFIYFEISESELCRFKIYLLKRFNKVELWDFTTEAFMEEERRGGDATWTTSVPA